jgi:hypothetical protein
MKRSTVALVASGFVSAALTATAAAAPPKIETSPVKFTMTSKACPKLPSGTTIRAKGTMRSVTTTTIVPGGATRVINSSHARGTATDQARHKYVFDYSNTFNVRNLAPSPTIYTGLMYDLFTLSGNGPVALVNGFLAQFTTDLGKFTRLEPIHAFGDPIRFSDVTPHCDPL